MKCPICRKELTEKDLTCPLCAEAFDPLTRQRLSMYIALQTERRAIENISAEFSRQAGAISERLNKLSEQLTSDITTLSLPVPKKLPQVQVNPQAPQEVPPDTDQNPANVQPEVIAAPPITAETPRPASGNAPSFEQDAYSELRLGQRWLLILGSLAVVAGMAYFLKYSIERGWINPILRVISCYLFGCLLMLSGETFRRRDFEKYGLSLTALGILLLYFASYAGFALYHLFGQLPAYAVMLLSTALAMSLAVRYASQGMVYLGILAGYAVPILLGTAQGDELIRLPYLLLLSLGISILCIRQQWRPQRQCAVFLAFLVYAEWFIRNNPHEYVLLPLAFLILLFLCFCMTTFYKAYKYPSTEELDPVVFVLNPLASLGLIYVLIANTSYYPYMMSGITLFYSLVFTVLSSLLLKNSRQDDNEFKILSLCAAVALTLVLPPLFSHHWLSLALAILAVALSFGGLRILNPLLVYLGVALLGLSIVKYLFFDYFMLVRPAAQATGERLLIQFALLGALAGILNMLRRFGAAVLEAERLEFLLKSLARVLIFLLWLCLTNECRLFFSSYLPNALHAGLLVLWILFGICLLLAGFRNRQRELRFSGIGLLGAVWLKVFLIDSADLSTPYRIFVLLVLGLFLIASSFLYHKFKSRVLNEPGKPDE